MAKSHPIGTIKKGALKAQLGMSPNSTIPTERLEKLKGHAKGILKKRVDFALAARGWDHNKT